MMKIAHLSLSDGTRVNGYSPDWLDRSCVGEVVFTTGMVGYPESLTDPSYAGQIIVFTYPLIGNYGVPSFEMLESDHIHPAGVVMSSLSETWEHSQSALSLTQWLDERRVPYLTGVDTRAVTQKIRSSGVMAGSIEPKANHSLRILQGSTSIDSVTHSNPVYYGIGAKTVVVVDCGVKKSIIRELVGFGLRVKVVPAQYDYTSEEYDGIVLSNGPGDPAHARTTIQILSKALDRKIPVFGICLGVQLLALAIGARTYKLPFGHRGHNQPCIQVGTRKAVITSQNHGYAIDEKSLPNDWRVTYRNLNDGTIEGISHHSLPFSGVQFHPEAAPGPNDTSQLIRLFGESLSV